jgi:hypothetical protein
VAASAKDLKRRSVALQAAKDLHIQVWDSCYKVTLPERGSGLYHIIQTATEVQQQKARIYDSTAPDSVNTGAATIMGAVAPSNDLWFGLDVGNESDEERRWLDGAAKFIWENIHASNFDAEACDGMVDEMIAGWFVLYLEERDEGGYYFECWPIGECRIASSKSGSMIDTVDRLFEYSVSQTVAIYGIDNVSDTVRKKFEDCKFDDKVKLQHIIQPRDLYKSGSKRANNMPFASCHIETDSEHVLRESGYEEFPCSVPRWRRLPGSAYSTGPMSSALPDVMTLNEMTKWTLMGAETAIAPPLLVANDGVLNAKNIRMGPRRVLVVDDVETSVKPLLTGADVNVGLLTAEKLQASVRKILLADQLPPADGPTKTAYEWSVRVQALRAMLGPMFGRFQAEFLQPLIERAFGIAWRANVASGYRLLGRPPMSLLNRSFTVRYLSPMARAQKMAAVDAMDRYETSLMTTAQMEPSVMDVYDWDAAERERGLLIGVSQKLVRDERGLIKYREAKNQAAQAKQQEAVQQQGQVDQQAAMAQRMATAE